MIFCLSCLFILGFCVCSVCIVAFFVFVLFCYNLMHVRCMLWLSCQYLRPPTLPFGRICFVVLVMRKGGESSWSGPWHLGCRSEVSFSICTATRTSSDSPVGPSVLFSLGLYFVCLYCFNLFVYPHPFVFPWAEAQLSHFHYRFWRWRN